MTIRGAASLRIRGKIRIVGHRLHAWGSNECLAIQDEPATVNDNGVLMLHGHFDTTPSRVNDELDFIMSDGEWKLIRINVQLK